MKIKHAIQLALRYKYQSAVELYPIVVELSGSAMKSATFERELRRYLKSIPHKVKQRVGKNGALYNVYIKSKEIAGC